MAQEVTAWLHELGLGRYAQAFEDNAVDAVILRDLTDADLRDLGVEALGHRKTILKALQALRADPEANGLAADPVAEDEFNTWSRTPGDRRPVTMLFADIANSTALTEKLDAEEAHELLYRATRHMCRAVEQNKGTVCRFMGDGVMAMFGAPMASERHALEACRAAIEMQERVAEYAGELQARHAATIQIRVGLNSGEVVVLDVGDDPDKPEYDASGPTVPLAARMEQSAEPGMVLMTEHTRNLAGGLVEVEKRPPISVKGISEPVEVFRLARVRSATGFDDGGPRRSFVGRKFEIAQFRGIIEACLESGLGQAIRIQGEAGIGKSRMTEEMSTIARARGFDCHRILVLDFGAGKGQRLVPSLTGSLIGVDSDSDTQARIRALNRALSEGLVQPEQRIFLYDLLDLDQPLEQRTLYEAMDAETRSRGKQLALQAMLKQGADRKPVLLVVEDLHWADEISLKFLARIAAAVAESPAILVMTSRPGAGPTETAWRAYAGEVPFTTWELAPLRRQEAEQLVLEIAARGTALVDSCIERAAGNPLFLEQLLASSERGDAANIPDSIKSLVLSRMDQLTAVDNQALRVASVLGQRFQLDILRHLIDQPDYDCGVLIERNLLRPDGAHYLFAHALIREAAYSALLRQQRNEWHMRAAQWYSGRDLVLRAEHLEHAGDSGAAMAYHAAAREQAGKFRPERALQLLRTGLDIVSATDRFELKYLEGELLRAVGSVAESIKALEEARAAASGDSDRCRAMVGLGNCLELIDAHEELIDMLSKTAQIARDNDMQRELARIYQLQGGAHFFKGQYLECLRLGELSLQCARAAAAPDLEASALSGLCDAEYSRGRYRSAKQYVDRCIALAREHGLGQIVAANLPMQAIMEMWQNDNEASVSHFYEARDLAVKTGHLRAEMIASIGGKFLADLGDLDEGEKWSRRALEISRQLGSRIFEGECLTNLAKLMVLRGNRQEAGRLANEAIAILRTTESGMTFYGPYAFGVLAQISEKQDDCRAEMEEAESILAEGAVSHNYFSYYEDAMEACLGWGAWDDVDRYADAMEAYTAEEPMPRCDCLIARGRALARRGRGEVSAELSTELERLADVAARYHLPGTGPVREAAPG